MTQENGEHLKALAEDVKTALVAEVDSQLLEKLSTCRGKPSPVQSFLTWTGGVSGLLAVSVWLVFGGKMIQRVEVLERMQDRMDSRMTAFETGGSVAFQRYEAENNARTAAIRERLAAVEKISEAVPRLEQSLTRVNTLLEVMQKQLDRMEKRP